MKHYVYIIQSDRNSRYYIGYSENPKSRLERHNQGWTRSTKAFTPWRLVHLEEFDSKIEALARERQLKSWKSHQAVEKLIAFHPEGRPDF